MKLVWEMLSDQKIMSVLGNPEQEIDQDLIRLMLIELFSRLKKVEENSLAMRFLLIESGIIGQDEYDTLKDKVQEFIKHKDAQNAAESDFFAQSGISFPQYVNFKLHGQFDQ